MKHRCIYSLKTVNEAKFNTQEHIIPACVGGNRRLPKGYVSDEVNELFSKLERPFARQTDIAIMREFMGPGKRGSLNPKKATTSEVRIFQNVGNHELGLGYIKLGKPYSINQIYIYKDTNRVKFSLAPSDNLSNSELLVEFWTQLEELCQMPQRINIIQSDKLEKSVYILGYHNRQWHLAIETTICTDKAREYACCSVKCMLEAKKNNKVDMPRSVDDVAITASQVMSNYLMEFDNNDRYRIIAKTAFNCLAHLAGSKYVLGADFDPIRKAIYEGEDMHGYFDLMNYDNRNNTSSFSDIFKTYDTHRNQKLGDQYHGILFFGAMDKQKCAVGFYGLERPHIVNLARISEKTYFGGFFCDWRARKEIDLIEYITTT